MNHVYYAVLMVLAVLENAGASDSYVETPLGESGITVKLPVGAVAYPGNGEINPNRKGGAVYGFHLSVDDNQAEEPLKIIVSLALPYFSGADAQRSFLSYRTEAERHYSKRWTWSTEGRGFHMFVMKDRGLKIVRKRFFDPDSPIDLPIRELWITYPLTQIARGDKVLKTIESTFKPYKK